MAEGQLARRMELVIPETKATWPERLAFATAAREALRLQHNAKGADFRAGRITKEAFETYVAETFRPRSAAISEAINTIKFDPPADVMADVDLDNQIRPTTSPTG